MGYGVQNKDNIMREMAREVNLMENDRKREAEKPVSESGRKRGIIVFWCMLVLPILIFLLFVLL